MSFRTCLPRYGGGCGIQKNDWIPAFAGMTERILILHFDFFILNFYHA